MLLIYRPTPVYRPLVSTCFYHIGFWFIQAPGSLLESAKSQKMSSESESAAAKDPRERLLGLKGPWDWPEDVSRFTCEEFMHAIANIDMRIEKSCKLAFHFTDVTSATYILDPASHGLRASKVGQHGGGLSMCMTPPYELAWEKHCVKTNEDAPFRRQVGEALWGEKYHEVRIFFLA